MKDIKFKIYYEAELNGEKLKGIEEPCSWFLLTQTGKIMEYGPVSPPSRPNKGYTKLVPLLSTGLLDKNGAEIYEGDILQILGQGWEVFYDAPSWQIRRKDKDGFMLIGSVASVPAEIIGNIYEHPELLNPKP